MSEFAAALGEPDDALEAELMAVSAIRAPRLVEAPTETGHDRGWVLRRALLTADVVGCALALLFVQFAIVHYQRRDFKIDILMVGGLASWIVLTKLFGLYDERSTWGSSSGADDLPAIFLLATLATWLGLVVLEVTRLSHPRVSVAATFWLTAIGLVSVGRLVARVVVQRWASQRERALILGSGDVVTEMANKLRSRREYGLDVIGYLNDDPDDTCDKSLPFLGDTSRLEQVIRAHQVNHVILAFTRMPVDRQVELSRRCLELNVQVDVVPRMFEVIGSRNRVHYLDGLPLVEVRSARLSSSSRLLKRSLDIVVAAMALLVLSPLMVYAALRIKAESAGPVFFRQERMGAGGRRFRIFKFRTMWSDADARKADVACLNKHNAGDPRMFKIPDDPRVTPFGRFLRKWSLDELPQLLNVLRGEMSMVGPRPLILVEDEHVIGNHRRRLNLLPGITGLWQVLGRSDIPFSEMVTLDYLYVTNWSLWWDIKLLFRTIPVILDRRGAY